MSKELLKQALYFINQCNEWPDYESTSALQGAIEAELAKPEQEPIFYGSKSAAHGGFLPCEKDFKGDSLWSPAVPLYESSPDYEVIKSELNAMNENCKGLIEERRKLKGQLFEARQALLKEGMRANALQARIDALDADASRYRWLRNDAWGCDKIGDRNSPHVCTFLSTAQLPGVVELAEEALDSAIDSAMKKR